MTLRNILIALGIILTIILGGFIVYNTFFKTKIETEDELSNLPTSPLTGTGQIKPISQEQVLTPIIDNNKVKYYSAQTGNVYQSNFDGSGLTRISSSILPGLLKILWSANKEKVIAIFENDNQVKKYFYDYNTGISTLLDKNIGWIAWSPNKDQIAYQYYNPATQENNINLADPDGSNWTNIFQTRMKNLIVEWPNTSQIAIRTRPSGLAQSVVYTIDLTNGDLKKVLNNTYGLSTLWSPLGDKILFSETNDQGKNLKLKIADLNQSTITELNLVTLPEKCVWSQDNRSIFCAVPQKISQAATLPDDYYKKVILFNDDFWRINLDTQEAVQIFEATNEETMAYDAKELLLPLQEDYLLFINQKDGLLYTLHLN